MRLPAVLGAFGMIVLPARDPPDHVAPCTPPDYADLFTAMAVLGVGHEGDVVSLPDGYTTRRDDLPLFEALHRYVASALRIVRQPDGTYLLRESTPLLYPDGVLIRIPRPDEWLRATFAETVQGIDAYCDKVLTPGELERFAEASGYREWARTAFGR